MLRLLLLLLLAAPATAQFPRELSDRAEISLLTLSPGEPVHTLFGHGALRVVDPEVGLDLAFNYGTFDFGPGFIRTFLVGELDYYLSVSETRYTLDEARAMDRVAVEQVFDLTADERQALYEALVENAHPDRRTYRYDFLFDNCSTRLVGVLRRSFGEAFELPAPPPSRTFRELLHEHLEARPWLRFGIDLLLGASVDRRATGEEEWFLPERFVRATRTATLDGAPLVRVERVVVGEEWKLPPRALDQASVVGWTLLALGVLIATRPRHLRLARAFDALLFFTAGLAGLVMLGMWVLTLHHVTTDNWNLVWALPTHVVAAALILTPRRPGWLRGYFAVAAVLALVAALELGIPQDLPDAVLPLGLLLSVRALVRTRGEAPAGSEPQPAAARLS